MNNMSGELPGLGRIKIKFVNLLSDRQRAVAEHTLASWNGETVEEVNGNLQSAQYILHQIAGSAGSLGFYELGQTAQECENSIIEHLEGSNADLALCPIDVASRLDRFVDQCQKLIDANP